MMTDWYQKATNALPLNGLGERTQEAYVRARRMLCEFYHKTPDAICEEKLANYFLRRRNVDGWSPNTMRICYCGIRHFYTHVLRREWHTLKLVRAQSERRLPAVLSREEVRTLLNAVHTTHSRTFLATVYACGLRLQEAQCLEVSDIDATRMMIHAHRGKGAKDRFVPLAKATLKRLRHYWCTHRHRRFLFPALGRSGNEAAQAQTPMPTSSIQGAFRRARQQAGINKRGVSVHTLRHCYATHLLEAGVNLRVIQQYLGHAQLETTMVYRHLSASQIRAVVAAASAAADAGASLHADVHRPRRPAPVPWQPPPGRIQCLVRSLLRRHPQAGARFPLRRRRSARLLRRPAHRGTTTTTPTCTTWCRAAPCVPGAAAISDARIVAVNDHTVSFTWRKVGSRRTRTLTLNALEFMRRFLQHVLPSGFMKVRYYGFLSPAAKANSAVPQIAAPLPQTRSARGEHRTTGGEVG